MENGFLGSGQLVVLAQSNGCSVYQAKNETGEGTITLYQVSEGISVAYNDFHMQYYDSEFTPGRDIFCIDHCREGRLEYPSRENAYSYVEAGDVKLDRRLNHTGHFELPLCHYHGVMISFDMELAGNALPVKMEDFPADLKRIRQKYCRDRYPLVIHGSPCVSHIFSELYAVPEAIRLPYFKIKIMELLLYLDALAMPDSPEERPYFYKTQVEKAKGIRHFLEENMDVNFTQEELSRRFAIPLTTMKSCFRSIYGTSIGSWLLQYRMNQAAVWLRKNQEVTVAEIAGRVGYDSPSKFAIAFRRVMGLSPTEYRKRI